MRRGAPAPRRAEPQRPAPSSPPVRDRATPAHFHPRSGDPVALRPPASSAGPLFEPAQPAADPFRELVPRQRPGGLADGARSLPEASGRPAVRGSPPAGRRVGSPGRSAAFPGRAHHAVLFHTGQRPGMVVMTVHCPSARTIDFTCRPAELRRAMFHLDMLHVLSFSGPCCSATNHLH